MNLFSFVGHLVGSVIGSHDSPLASAPPVVDHAATTQADNGNAIHGAVMGENPNVAVMGESSLQHIAGSGPDYLLFTFDELGHQISVVEIGTDHHDAGMVL